MAKPSQRRTFYVAMAAVGAVVAIVGFSRRYLVPVASGTMDAPAIVHIHGILMFAWIVFFLVQTLLVAKGNTALHRSLGLAGISLGTLLVASMLELAVLLLARELREGGPPFLREFVATLMSWALLIGALFASAIGYVKKPEIHKRLMVLTSAIILAPAFARIIQLASHDVSRLLRNDLANLPSDALVLAGIVADWRTRGRPHPAYLIGGAAIVAVQLVTLAVRTTPVWQSATTWLAALVT